MTMKATHVGECQGCGSIQKLPGGTLSTHGYQVQWHSFQGICPGTDKLPFEQDRAFVGVCITNAQDRLASAIARQQEIRATPTTIDFAYVTWDEGTTYRFPVTKYVKIIANEHASKDGYTWLSFSYVADDKIVNIENYKLPYAKTLQNAVAQLNERYAATFNEEINNLKSYIQWQQGRYAAWTVKPLKAVELVEEQEKAVKKATSDAKKADRDAKRREKALRAADRARKLLVKYEKLVPASIREQVANGKIEHHQLRDVVGDELLFSLPSMVSGLLHDEIERAHGRRGFDLDPRKVIEAGELS